MIGRLRRLSTNMNTTRRRSPTPNALRDPVPPLPSIPTPPDVTDEVVKNITTTLKELDEISATFAEGGSVVLINDAIDSEGRALKDLCIQLTAFLQDKASKARQNSLSRLSRKVSEVSQRICNNDDGVKDIENQKRELRWHLESFLFEKYLAGVIAKPGVYNNPKMRALNRVVKDLPRAKAAYCDSASRDKRPVTCLKGTNQLLLEEAAELIYDPDQSPICLLHGPDGVGKSTIARTIAERADDLHSLGASFFFSQDEIERKNAKMLFTTIAYQLCVYDEEFAEAIGSTLLTDRGFDATTRDPQDQLNTLILEPLKDIVKSRFRPVVIVIDALDECDDEDGPFVLAALNRLVQALPSFKIILTTRPREYFDHFLDHDGTGRVPQQRKIEDNVTDGDIRLYLEHSLSSGQVALRLPSFGTEWTARREEIETLVQAAGRLFIFASTAVLFILDRATCDPASQMKKLQTAFAPSARKPVDALDHLYATILNSIVPAVCQVKRYQEIIGTIAIIQNPLSVEVLASLIGAISREDIITVLERLKPVVSLSDNGIPRMRHKSFPDYIKDAKRCKTEDLHISPRCHHTRVAIRCFQIMDERLKRNIMNLGTPARFIENDAGLAMEGITEEQERENIAPVSRYACIYWTNHIKDANAEDAILMKELRTFSNKHLLHWFEALSWMGRLKSANHALRDLRPITSKAPDMSEVFSDGLRFISNYYLLIQHSALHMYHSALSFTPTQSLLYKRYNEEMAKNLCRLQGGREQWDSLVAVLSHGNWAMFSRNSSQLASWAEGDMKLWDAEYGTPVRTFHGDIIEIASDFSIAALSQERTVALYQVAGNEPLATFEHSTEVLSLSLSPDGSRLAVGLSDNTVCLWHREGKWIATLKPYACDRGQIAFSPSGTVLAFITDVGGIKLWNGANGELIADLVYESAEHTEFTFSQDGSRLTTIAKMNDMQYLTLWDGKDGKLVADASDVGDVVAISANGSWLANRKGKTVQLWCSGSEKTLSLDKTLHFRARIKALAFSDDILAIGSFFTNTVTLYNLQNHEFIATLPFPFAWSLAFSPDGNRLAAGNYHGILHLWDIPTIRASAPVPEGQSQAVTALAFSPDCSRLASGFKDGSVSLWDTSQTKKAIACHKVHSQQISALAFSPDGMRFASGSWDRTVKFWGGKDGLGAGNLEKPLNQKVTSLAFSTQLLAAGTDEDITLWDCSALRVASLLKGSHFLSFTLTGSQLASAFNHYFAPEVTLWDVNQRTPIATFKVDSNIEKLIFSPDTSHLAAQLCSGGFKLLDIAKKEIRQVGQEGISWVPRWNGIHISWKYDSQYGSRLLGQFSSYDGTVPVLWIPQDVVINAFTFGPTIFALGCHDGRVLFGRTTQRQINSFTRMLSST